MDGRRAVECLVHIGLQLDDLAAPPAAVGGDDELGLAVIDAVLDRLGTEAAKDDRVHGSDPGAGQHGDHGLGDHRQVDRDAVAGLDAHVFQDMGHAADVKMQLLVGNRADVARLALENYCRFVFAGRAEVPIDAVLGNI